METCAVPSAASVDATSTGEHFVAALAELDWKKLEACFHPEVQFRALVPSGLKELKGAKDAAARMQYWFRDVDRLQLLQKQIYPVSDRIHISYQFREFRSDGGTKVIEQHAYCDIRSGVIESIDIVCSGHLLEARETTGGLVHHQYDAGDLGCGSGLPQEFRRQVSAIPVGHVLDVVTRDPSAKEDLPSLARLLGHKVLSVKDSSDGTIVVTVQRGS
jgi:TusA-related sulfurtransferase